MTFRVDGFIVGWALNTRRLFSLTRYFLRVIYGDGSLRSHGVLVVAGSLYPFGCLEVIGSLTVFGWIYAHGSLLIGDGGYIYFGSLVASGCVRFWAM